MGATCRTRGGAWLLLALMAAAAGGAEAGGGRGNGRAEFRAKATDHRDLAVLTSAGDVWISRGNGAGFDPPVRVASLNYMHDPEFGWFTVAGDWDADGYTDLACVNGMGELWRTLNDGTGHFVDNSLTLDGMFVDIAAGHRFYAEETWSDGRDWLVWWGGPWELGWNFDKGADKCRKDFDTPVPWDLPGLLTYQDIVFPEGEQLYSLDLQGLVDTAPGHVPDGFSVFADGTLSYGFSNGAMCGIKTYYVRPTPRFVVTDGTPGSPNSATALLVGEFLGNGRDQVVWVPPARTNRTYMFQLVSSPWGSASRVDDWGSVGFGNAPLAGRLLLAADATGDGRCDLVEIGAKGKLRVAASTGSSFGQPFTTSPMTFGDRPWHAMVGDFVD